MIENHVSLPEQEQAARQPQQLPDGYTTRRAPHMERFTRIEPVPTKDEPNAHRVYLKVENQRFTITPLDCEDLKHAEWTRDMLCIALDNLVKECSR